MGRRDPKKVHRGRPTEYRDFDYCGKPIGFSFKCSNDGRRVRVVDTIVICRIDNGVLANRNKLRVLRWGVVDERGGGDDEHERVSSLNLT